jgi:antitoxin (DNA-binding transcriptional repressor) of toxin-antitoxin stability system
MGIKPGQNSGNQGGIFQQVTTTGKPVANYVTVPDNRPLPPTTKPGHTWKPVATTPNSKR